MIDRRTFGKAVGAGTAAASLAAFPAAPAAPAAAATPVAGTAAPFGPVKQIDAGALSVGYAEVGAAHGRPVVLLHGWPYDIHSYVDVAPILAKMGYRVIVPHLRGHGTTRFRSAGAFRNAQQAVFALDLLALMDALGIGKAVLAGYDWGSRTADIVAALWPHRVRALVSTTGYLITNREANSRPLPPTAEWAWWYQYYFATDRGRLGLEENRHDLAKLIWMFNSPTWSFDDATFDRTAASFANPDYVSIVIHNYRWRLGLAAGDPRYDALEARLAERPTIAVPTVTLDADKDPFTPAGDGASYRDRFTGRYQHRTLPGIGHNVPAEAPRAFSEAVRDADKL